MKKFMAVRALPAAVYGCHGGGRGEKMWDIGGGAKPADGRIFHFRRPVQHRGEAGWVRTSRYRCELRICRSVLDLLLFLFILTPKESGCLRIVQWSILCTIVSCCCFTGCDIWAEWRSGRRNLPGLLYLFWLLFLIWPVFGYSWWVDTLGGLVFGP